MITNTKGFYKSNSIRYLYASPKRFEEQGESYFLFIEDPNVEPTNNIAEREIRTLVLDRLVTQGVWRDGGNEWHERFWTVLATCRRLGLNVMTFLRESLFLLYV